MSYPIWPFGLPSQSYSIRPASVSLRTRMQSGSERKRQQFTVDTKRVQVEFEMEDTQFGYFEAWFRGILNQGSAWFLMRIALGTSIKEQRVRFVESYEASYTAHAHWSVKAEIEVTMADLIDPNMLSLLLDESFLLGLDDFENALELYRISIHETMFNDLS